MLQRVVLVIVALLIFVGGYRFGVDHAKFLKLEEQAAAGLAVTAVVYDDLPGWSDDIASDFLPADWTDTVAAYFEEHFIVDALSIGGADEGLMTGYYAPVLDARLQPEAGFDVPLYARPDDLQTINLVQFDPALKGKAIHGRWDEAAQRFVPYDDRAALDRRDDLVPIAYVADKVTRFFLQIQGSGLLKLADGSMMRAAYAGKNGRPYYAIGRDLIASGAITKQAMSMQAIRDWLAANPVKGDALMDQNPAYTFFSLSDDVIVRGAANVPLKADQSVAVDPAYHPYGSLFYVVDQTTGAGRIVRADDTGGAIKGPLRLDLYRGLGDAAGNAAGGLKAPIKLYRLTPRPVSTRDGLN